jgi:endo-1,4-beta-D-glucanase Y
MSLRTQGILLLIIACSILLFVLFKNSTKRQIPIIFSPRNALFTLWQSYKQDYLEPDTYRTLDKQKDFITTSEGESYTMLRSVWLDDKDTFDKSWKWTKDNLQRDDNKLFSWLFGKKSNGTYGILEERGGQNTATDADVDIALSLVFASSRWNDGAYLADAKTIIGSIWNEEVIMIKGKPYLAANNLEQNAKDTIIINPSYFAPYAYRVFAKVDPNHPWLQLVDTSYDVLNRSIDAPLGSPSSAHIPPDWVFMNRKTGALVTPQGNNLTANMSFDALRVPWRIALDYEWNHEPRAKDTLEKMSFLSKEWETNYVLYTTYGHDGLPLPATNTKEPGQSAAFYGGTIGYFMVADPENGKTIYETKLQYLFNPDTNTWKTELGYYDDNWAWFGIALYNGLLTNLAN